MANLSANWQTNQWMEWTDVAFDYWVRQYRTTLTVAAGNNGSYVASPGKAWNVITVGAYDDHNTISWAGDTVWAFSNYVNPQLYSGTQDREKPELVAPGVSIRMIDTNNNPVPWPGVDGTSYAAPQVAGLAALLMQRSSDLVTLPNAVKAILMASAVHNIEGYPDFRSDPNIPDLRDGAGGIAGAFADTTAQVRANVNDTCSNSCWWNVAITDTVFTQQGGAMLPLHFEAAAGNRVRVAISWWAQSVATPIPIWWAGDWHYMGNVLSINLDLVVRDPTGQEVARSATFSNNYELVDFLAQRSGVYTIEVWRTSSSDTTNEVGVAFTQLHQIYLPLIGKNF